MGKRLVVAMTGATGAVLGIDLLEAMGQVDGWETHLVISRSAERTIELETDWTVAQVKALAARVYPVDDIGANIASGSFRAEGMVVMPCSMKTVAGIACGYSDNLVLRAADVMIKERRRLVLVARESPLSPIHLQNMLTLAQCGAMIVPPVLTYYNHPKTVGEMTRHIVGKVLGIFEIEAPGFKRWGDCV